MTLAVAFDDVKEKRKRNEIKNFSQIPFVGSRGNPDLPLATYYDWGPGRVSGTHFHVVDQFQLVLDGKCTLGRHHLAPYGVHFTRAYTPYGPLVADAEQGLKFFALRAHADTGTQPLPREQEQLNRVPNRDPWQVSRVAAMPVVASETTLQAIPGIEDDRGLAAYTLKMKPDARIQGPDPSSGDGQWLVVVKGSVLHDGRNHEAPALVWAWPKDGPLPIQAGAQGLEGLILNYPRPRTTEERAAPGVQAAADFKVWQCQLCAFTYDEALGLPEEGIAPGTRWQDVPESWSCPDCSVSKSDFRMVEI
jgi:rubredoxin